MRKSTKSKFKKRIYAYLYEAKVANADKIAQRIADDVEIFCFEKDRKIHNSDVRIHKLQFSDFNLNTEKTIIDKEKAKLIADYLGNNGSSEVVHRIFNRLDGTKSEDYAIDLKVKDSRMISVPIFDLIINHSEWHWGDMRKFIKSFEITKDEKIDNLLK